MYAECAMQSFYEAKNFKDGKGNDALRAFACYNADKGYKRRLSVFKGW